MTYYVPCPSCPELRPDYERGLVPKGEPHCRMCQPKVKKKVKVKKRADRKKA